MSHLSCTEPVCRHEWSELANPEIPRCPRCGGFWVRVVPDAPRGRPAARRRGRLLARPGALAGRSC